MTRGDPDLRRHEDPGIEAHDVVAQLDHRPPPGPLDVVLELDAERSVIPHRVDPAVDLAAREDETAPLRQRDDGLQVCDGRRDVLGVDARAIGHGQLRWAAGRGRDGCGKWRGRGMLADRQSPSVAAGATAPRWLPERRGVP